MLYHFSRCGLVTHIAESAGDKRKLIIQDLTPFLCWDCLCPDSVKMIYERSDLSGELKRKILSENAARLFGL